MVTTFSRTFPSYHPRKSKKTYFVEKFHYSIWNQCHDKWEDAQTMIQDLNKHLPKKTVNDFIESLEMEMDFSQIEKNHTVRGGHRYKAGDLLSPRVWGNDINPKSGRRGPYHSKQIIIGPDIQIKKTWDFHVDACGVMSMAKPGQQLKYIDEDFDAVISNNDGLTVDDFIQWIVMPFYKKGIDSGPMQIICWNEKVEYG